MYKNISIFMLLVMVPLGGYAEIYKWKGENGEMYYSDIPPQGKVQTQSLKAKPKAPTPQAPVPQANQGPAGLTPAAKNAVNGDVMETETLESRQNRAKACDVAKSNLAKLKAGGNIYRDNEKGERQYLDETTIKKELESAQKEVDTICPKY
jgi:hypothetical protein